MDFSLTSLASNLIFGIIGAYYFRQGKKDQDYVKVFTGIFLFAYTYFVSDHFFLWAIGIGLIAGEYFLQKKL